MPWELLGRFPSAGLRGDVGRYLALEADLSEGVEWVELSRGHPLLVVGFGDCVRLQGLGAADQPADRLQSFLVGPEQGPLLCRLRGRCFFVEINLTPWALAEILGVAPGALGSSPIALEDVLGPDAPALSECLRGHPDWQARLAALETFLCLRLRQRPRRGRAPTEVQWAWHHLQRSGGTVGVDQLVRELGWSHRYLAARFRQFVGLTPKAAARRLRFARVHRRLAAGDQRPLAAIARQAGYADQSHMTREFREFGACTPAEYRGRVLSLRPPTAPGAGES
ncbi:helix-turn-helix domain-containing protein [Alkalilimnicola ehrlichii MLHE-1]|uniref:AraC family transcriptional regulator n=1 Tax=Alkalilimnicola ehrlichii TaxID=351052 RepID=UPI000315979D